MRVRYDPNFHGTACLQGLWPFQTITVGDWYDSLPIWEREAVYLHELAHSRLFHVELTVLALLLPVTWFAIVQKRFRLNQEFAADLWVARRHRGGPLLWVLRRLQSENGLDEERTLRIKHLERFLKKHYPALL